MELYILDDNFQRTEFVESYKALIWTERYNESGDITLVFPKGDAVNDLIREGIFLGLDGSADVVMIDTVTTKDNLTTAVGKTLTEFLKQRIFRNSSGTATSTWNIFGMNIGAACSEIVYQMCAPGGYMDIGSITNATEGPYEVIPGINPYGSSASSAALSIAIPYGNLYDAIKAICDLDGVGFRLVPDDITSSSGIINFDTYRGLDRTSDQSINELVVFEPGLDSLSDVEEIRSITDYKNAAWAWAAGLTDPSTIGYATIPGTPPTGFDRRTLMVDASDINAPDYSPTDLKLLLDKRAANALVNNNYIRTTDGKIVPQEAFIYGADYVLGDVIELRGDSNVAQKARITEYIRSEDEAGEVAYPTLSIIS